MYLLYMYYNVINNSVKKEIDFLDYKISIQFNSLVNLILF